MTGVARIAFVVRGRVQGVGFRWFAQEAARGAGVHGFVRNEADGTVTGEAEADAAALAAFLTALRAGPRFGRVDAVETAPLSPRGDADFRIDR